MKIKFILLFLPVLFLFNTACDDYLDVMPDSRTELDTDEKIANLLVSAYPTHNFVYMSEMSSDNTDWRESSYTSLNLVQEQLFAWEDVKDNSGNDSPEAFWESSYEAIGTANVVLKKIEELGNPERFDPQRGEALMVRAYNHFYLVNIFGKHYSEKTSETDLGVPYVEEPETTVNPHYERDSVAEVYRKVERDMLAGLQLIDDNVYGVPKYHFNRKAAYAFATRFYLFCRQYDKVIEYANLVLGENPKDMLRDMKQFTALTSDFQLRAKHYVKMEHNANLLIASLYSSIYSFGNYNSGKRYLHSALISNTETIRSPGPWGIYSAALYYLASSSYTAGYVSTPKIPYYFEYTNPIARTGYSHSI
ncbi:MAG: RagB/SusD family nutrient uptake outer membrane protein, partial [Dysgonamonadaceae bacterium]|nr:RagB/SusD family nutrient uptake outer membrane protein [Dysgonamonadaceae bacterium]